MGDHLYEIGWHATLGNRDQGRQAPRAIDFNDCSLIDQIVEQRRDEQRLAPGPLEHRLGQGRSQCVVTEPQREIPLDFCPGQSIETQFGAAPMDPQILVQPPYWMAGAVGRSIGAEDQHLRLARVSGKAGEHVHRREVAPMQILQDENPRPDGAQRFQKIAKLAQHALAGCAEHVLLERGAVRFIDETGYVQQPGWCMGTNCHQQFCGVRGPTAACQRVNQRQEGFIGTEPLGAASA